MKLVTERVIGRFSEYGSYKLDWLQRVVKPGYVAMGLVVHNVYWPLERRIGERHRDLVEERVHGE